MKKLKKSILKYNFNKAIIEIEELKLKNKS